MVYLFGLRSIGALMGTVMAMMGLMGSGGPVFSGLIFDVRGRYVPAFLFGTLLLGISISLSFALRPPGPPQPSSVPQPLIDDAAGGSPRRLCRAPRNSPPPRSAKRRSGSCTVVRATLKWCLKCLSISAFWNEPTEWYRPRQMANEGSDLAVELKMPGGSDQMGI